VLSIWGGFKKRIVTTFIGLVGMGLPFAVVGFLPADAFVLSLVFVFVSSITMPIVNGTLGAVMQATVDPSRQGRVFTLTGSLATAMTPLGLLVAGPLSDAMGIQIWFIVGGLLCAAMGVVGFFIPSVMNIEAGRPDDKPKTINEISEAIEAT
jgi:DHA3 family macrolide efflux protein-like MFS transporter